MISTTTQTRTHAARTLGEKSATTKRFEAEGLIVLVRDASFAGEEFEVTDCLRMVIEAETLELAMALANDALEGVQINTGMDSRKENFVKIEQVD